MHAGLCDSADQSGEPGAHPSECLARSSSALDVVENGVVSQDEPLQIMSGSCWLRDMRAIT